MRQEFAYEKKVEEAFNLDESVFLGSDDEKLHNEPSCHKRDPYKPRMNQVAPDGAYLDQNTQEMAPAVKAKENKKTYLRNYAIEFELPSKVIKGSKIYRKDPRYIFQVLNYLIPKPDETPIQERKPRTENVLSDEEVSDDAIGTDQTMVHTFKEDGTSESKTFAQ